VEKTKQFLHLKQTDTFELLEQSNSADNGSLPEIINIFFVSVSAHLSIFDSSPLEAIEQDFSQEYVIDPTQIESRLLHINVHKHSGPDGLPSWLLRDLASLAQSTFSSYL